MTRHNGSPVSLRTSSPHPQPQFLERRGCLRCGRLVPRGSDRPFCFDHASYAQALIRQLAEMDAKKRDKAA